MLYEAQNQTAGQASWSRPPCLLQAHASGNKPPRYVQASKTRPKNHQKTSCKTDKYGKQMLDSCSVPTPQRTTKQRQLYPPPSQQPQPQQSFQQLQQSFQQPQQSFQQLQQSFQQLHQLFQQPQQSFQQPQLSFQQPQQPNYFNESCIFTAHSEPLEIAQQHLKSKPGSKNSSPHSSPPKRAESPSQFPPTLPLPSSSYKDFRSFPPFSENSTKVIRARSADLEHRNSHQYQSSYLDFRRTRDYSPKSRSMPDRLPSLDCLRELNESYLVVAWMHGQMKTDVEERGDFNHTTAQVAHLSKTQLSSFSFQGQESKTSYLSPNPNLSLEDQFSSFAISLQSRPLPCLPIPRNFFPRHPPVDYNQRLTAMLFEKLKADSCREQHLRSFVEEVPKTDLHNHMTGSIPLNVYLNFAVKRKLFFDRETCLFHAEEGQNRITAEALRDVSTHSEDYNKFRKAMIAHGCSKDSPDGHDQFFKTFTTIESLTKFMPLYKQIKFVVKHEQNQNVKYLELMIELLPSKPLPNTFADCFARSGDDKSEALNLLSEWLESYVSEQIVKLDTCNAEVSSKLKIPSIVDSTSPIVVKYLLEIMRDLQDHIFFAYTAAAMALIKAYPHTVGLNVVGPEDMPFAKNHFHTQMKILKFLHEKFGQPNISLHAGELNSVLSGSEKLHHIRDSIFIGQAKRIGHGASLAHERVPEVLELMKEKNIAVEICLTSNKKILGIDLQKHAIKFYRQWKIPISLSPDDATVNCSSLNDEIMIGIEEYDLNYYDLKKMALDGIRHSFLPEKFVKGGKSPKLIQVQKMEAAFKEFEASVTARVTKGYRALDTMDRRLT